MATTTKTQKQEAAEMPMAEKTEAPAAAESIYTAEELANNHKALGTYREIVVVALRQANLKTATFSQAKKVVEKFKHREVK